MLMSISLAKHHNRPVEAVTLLSQALLLFLLLLLLLLPPPLTPSLTPSLVQGLKNTLFNYDVKILALSLWAKLGILLYFPAIPCVSLCHLTLFDACEGGAQAALEMFYTLEVKHIQTDVLSYMIFAPMLQLGQWWDLAELCKTIKRCVSSLSLSFRCATCFF